MRVVRTLLLLVAAALPVLSQITLIQGSDPISYSRTTINTNFTYLQSALAGKANLSHVHLAADVSNFANAVSTNSAVAANTAARHNSFQLGSKTLSETLIGNGKAIVYNSTTGQLEFALIEGGAGTGDVGATNPWNASDRVLLTDGASGKNIKQGSMYWDGNSSTFIIPGKQQVGASGSTYRGYLALYGHGTDAAQPAFVKLFASGTAASIFACSGNRLCVNQGSGDPATSTDYIMSKSDAGTVLGLANSTVSGTNGTYARSDHQHKRDLRIKVGATDYLRNSLKLIAGANVTLTPVDDAGNDEVQVTIASSGTGSAGVDSNTNWTLNERIPVTDGTGNKLVKQSGLWWDTANTRFRIPGDAWVQDADATYGMLLSLGGTGRTTRSGLNVYGGDVAGEMGFLKLFVGGNTNGASLFPCSTQKLCYQEGTTDPTADSTNYLLRKNDTLMVQAGGSAVNAIGRKTLNFIQGSNVTLSVTDDSANDKVNVTVSSSAGASGGNTKVFVGYAASPITMVQGTQHTLWTTTIPANTMGQGGCLEIKALTTTAPTTTIVANFYIKFGTQPAQQILQVSGNEKPQSFNGLICNKASVTNQQEFSTLSVFKGTQMVLGASGTTLSNPSWAVDTSSNQTLQLYAVCTAATCVAGGSENITPYSMLVTLVK